MHISIKQLDINDYHMLSIFNICVEHLVETIVIIAEI